MNGGTPSLELFLYGAPYGDDCLNMRSASASTLSASTASS